MGFQIAWSESTPGEKHVSFSGHKTACGLSVIEAEPVYDSKPEDVTCWLCGGALTFDVTAAQKKAVEFVRAYPGAQKWSNEGVYEFAHGVADRVAGVAWHVKKEHRSWNTNHVFSEFMAYGGYMTDDSPTARMIGLTAQAVLEVLTESNE
ncbi:hypothetical protein ACFVYF_18935 [Streptomyces sp. NPDC058274]|uniref:hypothetical protein n=1 Tax=Streptomyces sp. NPDC058274 TaxID=3346416 RepID=UPI0036ED97B9